ncbi:plasmid stability protein [Methylobacterium sp. BE186]|uniref:ribbon-helix-helix protein, CopG family n=1 Tax=Methylobacterium sp. BE186 TaxID=2817715 RepID=UPI002866932C|nr:plasmid stability protein [Methylobacterium sp. BE186]
MARLTPTTIRLPEDVAIALMERARTHGISAAEHVRRLIEAQIRHDAGMEAPSDPSQHESVLAVMGQEPKQ